MTESAPSRGDQKAEWDIVICGAGISGLVAAQIAAETGLKTLVLEANPTPGGNAAISGGIIWAPDGGLSKFRELVPEGDADLQRAYLDHFEEALGWLESHGHALAPTSDMGGLGSGRAMLAGQVGRREEYMAKMASTAEASGAVIRYSTPLTGAKRVGGLFEIAAGGTVLHSRGLLLATGGFQGNKDLLDRFIGYGAGDALYLRSSPTSKGSGLLTAISLGGACSRNMMRFYGHVMPDGKVPLNEIGPLAVYMSRQGVMLNTRGERFADETEGRLEETNSQYGWSQPRGYFYLVFDSRIYRDFGLRPVFSKELPQIDRLQRWRESGAQVLTDDTLEGLVAQLAAQEGFDAARTQRLLHEYNAACRAKDGNTLVPRRNDCLFPLEEGPFYSLRVRGGITATSGGIQIDPNGHVLGFDGAVIPSLYAAGTDAGGVFGKTYGGFLGWALVSGLLAGRCAARELQGS
ncbi:FAD-dependent oxidoreductase [Burkholderia sp. WSM2230]|uniref:FAD-dependent oxidoreductase n=1 Tax=Burkholderia sp. WSM2230 TaxID=944435 RepID=UPI000A049878|nr:FAD-dependent oxidoreductase [Burkholderia sp. WSM2230]